MMQLARLASDARSFYGVMFPHPPSHSLPVRPLAGDDRSRSPSTTGGGRSLATVIPLKKNCRALRVP
jgi:hypothetical protein